MRLIHRYVGLALALFIILVSVTGSLLAFNPELERLTAPDWFAEPQEDATLLSIPELVQVAVQHDPSVFVTDVWVEPDRARVGVSAVAPETDPGYSEMVLNPYTGELLGQRHAGALGEGWHNLMPFIYEFHYSLLLGDTGIWLLGIIALIWFVDCFTGLIITFPRRRSASGKSWLSRWKKAWKIKTGTRFTRFNFDVHRAFSLWLWVVLGIFAWSSVYMNLWDSFYTQVTRTLMPYHPPWYELEARPAGANVPPHAFQKVYEAAERAMQEQARSDQFDYQPRRLSYQSSTGVYRYRVYSSLDVSDRLYRTDLYLDAHSLQPVLTYYPSRQHLGNTVSNWLHALHTGKVWGLVYQIVVCVLGLFLVVITVSGVLIWWQRKFRRVQRGDDCIRSSKPVVADSGRILGFTEVEDEM